MQTIIENFSRAADAFLRETSRFDGSTWCVVAVVTVTIGYFLLRGNAIRAV